MNKLLKVTLSLTLIYREFKHSQKNKTIVLITEAVYTEINLLLALYEHLRFIVYDERIDIMHDYFLVVDKPAQSFPVNCTVPKGERALLSFST